MPSDNWSPASGPAPQPRPLSKPSPRGGWGGLITALSLAAIMASGYFALPSFLPFHPHDDVSESEAQRRTEAFASMTPVLLPVVQPEERPAATAAMRLLPSAEASLQEDTQRARVKLVWITLFDANAEDGDAVRVETDGFRQDVVLRKSPVRIAIPVGPTGTVRLTGIIDGEGGGVTPGIVTPLGPVPLPVLSVGQSINVPVIVP